MKDTIQTLGNAEAKKTHFPSRAVQEAMLQYMVRLRQIDDQLAQAYSRGKIPMHFPVKGQEGFLAGIRFGLSDGDWWFPTAQTPGRRGLEVEGESSRLHVVRDASPGASRLVHANGVAWAARLQGGREVAAVGFGESIANQDNFHVALNFAGVHKNANTVLLRNTPWAPGNSGWLRCRKSRRIRNHGTPGGWKRSPRRVARGPGIRKESACWKRPDCVGSGMAK